MSTTTVDGLDPGHPRRRIGHEGGATGLVTGELARRRAGHGGTGAERGDVHGAVEVRTP